MDSDSDDEIGCGYGSSDGEGADKIDKKKTCGQCGDDFVGVDHDNRPVINPCGCVLHWYCRYKYSKYSRYGDGRACPSCGANECDNCKKLRHKIKMLVMKNAQLKSKIAAQPPQQQQEQATNKSVK